MAQVLGFSICDHGGRSKRISRKMFFRLTEKYKVIDHYRFEKCVVLDCHTHLKKLYSVNENFVAAGILYLTQSLTTCVCLFGGGLSSSN